MTFYRTIVNSNSNNWIESNTLEGVAIRMKRTKSEMDTLADNYELLQEKLSDIVHRQKEVAKQYKELKETLVSLANDIEDGEE